MNRRSFVTLVLSAGILAVPLGSAKALPSAPPRDHLVPADGSGITSVWWRHPWHRRWGWHRHHWRRW